MNLPVAVWMQKNTVGVFVRPAFRFGDNVVAMPIYNMLPLDYSRDLLLANGTCPVLFSPESDDLPLPDH